MATIHSHTGDAIVSDINVAPLVDVLFVLLVVFVLLGSLVPTAGFQRELLSCGCNHRAEPREPLAITVLSDGRIFVGGRRTDSRSIYGLLARIARTRVRFRSQSPRTRRHRTASSSASSMRFIAPAWNTSAS